MSRPALHPRPYVKRASSVPENELLLLPHYGNVMKHDTNTDPNSGPWHSQQGQLPQCLYQFQYHSCHFVPLWKEEEGSPRRIWQLDSLTAFFIFYWCFFYFFIYLFLLENTYSTRIVWKKKQTWQATVNELRQLYRLWLCTWGIHDSADLRSRHQHQAHAPTISSTANKD